MHHNSSNICLLWPLKVTLSFKFKNSVMPFVPPSRNFYQQKKAGHNKNLSQNIITKYLSLSSNLTSILSSPQKKKTFNHSQEHSEFILKKMTLSLPLKQKNTCQTHYLHEHWQWILTSCLCCLFHESSPWITWNQFSRPCDLISPWRRGESPTIKH